MKMSRSVFSSIVTSYIPTLPKHGLERPRPHPAARRAKNAATLPQQPAAAENEQAARHPQSPKAIPEKLPLEAPPIRQTGKGIRPQTQGCPLRPASQAAVFPKNSARPFASALASRTPCDRRECKCPSPLRAIRWPRALQNQKSEHHEQSNVTSHSGNGIRSTSHQRWLVRNKRNRPSLQRSIFNSRGLPSPYRARANRYCTKGRLTIIEVAARG